MRLAIISDIHGNLEALSEVYKDILKSKVDYIICLGDLVGYGPEPEKVILFCQNKQINCILGNHELAIFDDDELDFFNEDAYKSILLTRKLISDKSLLYIKKLPQYLIKMNLLFVHGLPPDYISEYVSFKSDAELIDIMTHMKQQIAFVGHTHELKVYSYDNVKITKKYLHKGIKKIDKKQKHIINVGSVGQPRDGNNNAKYIIFDTSNFEIETKLIPYNITITSNAIKEKKFPKFNASRLW